MPNQENIYKQIYYLRILPNINCLGLPTTFSHVIDKYYCDGKETDKGYLTLNECADVCRSSAQMFIHGTYKYGTNRCKGCKCKCYCQYATSDYKCLKRKEHKGYILYKYPTKTVSFSHVEDKVYCDGTEQYKDYLSLADCARACEGSSQMFIHGTNQFGNNRCNSDGRCRCYCQQATAAYACTKKKAHTGYILYSYPKKEAYFNHMEDKVECGGSFTYKGYVTGSEVCAKMCVGTSEVFTYGTNKFGEPRCKSSGCRCYCMHNTVNGKCKDKKNHKGYVLYSFTNKQPEKKIGTFDLCSKDTAITIATCKNLPKAMCEIEGRSSKRVQCLAEGINFVCKGVSPGESVKCCDYKC